MSAGAAHPPAPGGGTVSVRVPRVLAADVDGARGFQRPVPAVATLAGLLDELRASHPLLERRLRDETGALRRFVNVYVDGADVRHGDGLGTPVHAGQAVEVIQSVAGG